MQTLCPLSMVITRSAEIWWRRSVRAACIAARS
jgi:hypothetical protein